jgi:hypothetical protein
MASAMMLRVRAYTRSVSGRELCGGVLGACYYCSNFGNGSGERGIIVIFAFNTAFESQVQLRSGTLQPRQLAENAKIRDKRPNLNRASAGLNRV